LKTTDTRVREACRHVSTESVRFSSLYSKMGLLLNRGWLCAFASEFEQGITVIRVNSFVVSCVVLKLVKLSY